MACWDIIGKDCGQPVYKLPGGQTRGRVRTYTYIYDDPAARTGAGSPLSRDVWLNPAYAASFEWHDGYLLPPQRPGLGFNLREDVARNHAPHGPQPATIRSY
jgi:L-alanine-DL-glutamate epimerase-like enolase superfamily enzyme